MGTIVKYHTILQYLTHRSTFMPMSGLQDLYRRARIRRHSARKELPTGAETEFRRRERVFNRAEG